jgi:hypothetical protein
VNCASSVNITKAGKLGFVPRCCKNHCQDILVHGNLVVTRTVHAAYGRDTAVVLTTLSRQSNEEQPLALIPVLC